ncbi:MAG: 4Fe-4S binding protein [Candidatus Methanoperedens sp.]
MKVDIQINQSKCIGAPYNCNKCMQACPRAIFVAYPSNRQVGVICNKWLLEVPIKELCIGCKLCEKACPKEAIKVILI